MGDIFDNRGRYRRLVGKLKYLTVRRSDIIYAMSVVSQFLSAPRTTHWDAIVWILKYLKKVPGKWLMYSLWTHWSC